IDAVDLSPRLLDLARRGRYPELSFRQLDEGLKRRHFTATPDGWEISATLREAVHFCQGNLVAPGFLAGEPPFDLVFCRNLFIYLAAPARRRARDPLDRLLAPEGLLCMGHAEPLDPAEGRFRATGPAGFFLYRRTPVAPAPPPRPLLPLPPW